MVKPKPQPRRQKGAVNHIPKAPVPAPQSQYLSIPSTLAIPDKNFELNQFQWQS